VGAALDIVQQAYEAFGRRDITALMKLIADEVDWECVAPATLPYAGRRRTHEEVANFFEELPKADDIHDFEPREFIEAGEHVIVLGWEKTTAVETKKLFEPNGYTSSPLRAVRLLAGVACLIRRRVTTARPH
jgi:uncharacterized protein